MSNINEKDIPTTAPTTFKPNLDDSVHPRRWPPQRYTLPLPNPPPKGICTPNGLPWGHSPRDFFRVVLPPSDDQAVTVSKTQNNVIWSRSMIKEAWGEDAFDYEVSPKGKNKEEGGEREPAPRIRRPWPVLGLCTRFVHWRNLNMGEEEGKLGLGVIDEGSEHDGKFETRVDRGDEPLDEVDSTPMPRDIAADWTDLLKWATDEKRNVSNF
jgi:hypothetical protein